MNFLYHGENLQVTTELLKEYEGKIKCIYIDPPYNTKSCFKHYDDNLEHSLWLNMMKERLIVLHKLLREDGSIWISIDASEGHYLKVLCDEIFGRKNFIDEVVWERAYAPVNLKKTLSRSHDNILVYAKKSDGFYLNKLERTEVANSRYKNLDNDPRGVWKSGDLSVGPVIKEKVYPITTPSGRIVYPPKGYCWRLTKSRLKEYINDNRIWFGKDGNNVPSLKRFLSEVNTGITSMTLWKREDVGDSQEAKREAKEFNSDEVFQTPKPERLLQRILHIATKPGDIVLDSFAGSGTTGAVAHKMGRRWIMIELGEHCHTHIIPRLEKVISGEDQGGISALVDWKGGGEYQLICLDPCKNQDLKA
jgi:adenine-specific DNA-methyltransferase